MQDKYYGFDPYEADIIDSNDYIVDNADDDFIVEHFDEYRAALELQTAKEIRVSKANIDKRRLNQKHAQEMKVRGLIGFIAGTIFAGALTCVTPQVKGADYLGNEVYSVMNDNGYGWRDDSQSGIVFNQYDSYVDYNSAINSIRNKCEMLGMTDAQIDVGLDTVLHIKPTNSTVEERIDARSDAYHQSKVNVEGKSK